MSKIKTRKSSSSFIWDSDCFFCCTSIKKGEEFHVVHKKDLHETILNECESRLVESKNETWAVSVKARLMQCIDLVSSGARYHQSCRVKFSKLRPHITSAAPGRPVDNDKQRAFDLTCKWLESEPEINTVSNFANKMKEISGSGEAYINKHIQHLLQQRYGSCISFQSEGKENLIYFQDTASYLIEGKFKKNLSGENEQDIMISKVETLYQLL